MILIFAVLDVSLTMGLTRCYKIEGFLHLFLNYLMAFAICYWAKLSQKSENAVADDRVLKFSYDADIRHVESSVRCHEKYKNGRIKVDLG